MRAGFEKHAEVRFSCVLFSELATHLSAPPTQKMRDIVPYVSIASERENNTNSGNNSSGGGNAGWRGRGRGRGGGFAARGFASAGLMRGEGRKNGEGGGGS